MNLEILNFLFLAVAAGLSVYLFFSFGQGALRLPFLGIASSIVLLLIARIFVFAVDAGIYNLHEVNLHIWWHMIFAFSMICFIIGGKKLRDIAVNPAEGSQLRIIDIFYPSLFIALSLSMFLFVQSVEDGMSALFVGSIVDSLGIHHLVVVILAAIAAWYVLKIKQNWGAILNVSVYPFFIFISLMAVQHIWELLTESWKVIILSHETIELVEQYIILPGFAALIIGLYGVMVATKASRSA